MIRFQSDGNGGAIYASNVAGTGTVTINAATLFDGKDYNSLRLPIGARINKDIRRNNILWTPEIRAFYIAELCDTETRVGSAFASSTGAGTFFSDSGASGRNGGLFGAGLTAQLTKLLSVGVDYDYEIWEHYDRHNVGARATVRW